MDNQATVSRRTYQPEIILEATHAADLGPRFSGKRCNLVLHYCLYFLFGVGIII
jgi:hypothetical protein